MMSSEIAIKVDNLGKCYHIFEKPHDRLLQLLSFGRRHYYREFWALKGVSFDIRQGETVAIIGRNGSGKSTLLQLLCGTLNPTTGDIQVNGRVAALLELGAGFNPEFSGRENVYLSASLYGLSRKQIDERMPLIATFADIGDHLDHPVKTYSSGMFLRLAFAVIAHVDADILVIDEALAVGDAVFTQKCMRFLRTFQQHGTLLFVSHDMNSVLNLCQSAIWLNRGEIRAVGPSKSIAEGYLQYTLQEVYGNDVKLSSTRQSSPDGLSNAVIEADPPSVIDYASQTKVETNLNAANGWSTGAAEIIDVKLERLGGDSDAPLQGGERVRMTVRAHASREIERPILGFLVRDRLGQDLFGENTLPFTSLNPLSISEGEDFVGEFVFRLPMLPNGYYSIMASVAEGDLVNNIQHHWLHDALILNVSSSKIRWGLVGVPFEHVSLTRD